MVEDYHIHDIHTRIDQLQWPEGYDPERVVNRLNYQARLLGEVLIRVDILEAKISDLYREIEKLYRKGF